ncbi:hypothetical protein BRC65_08175 [Halobacteriales archaeon QH_2_65_14]|nr:MAG: hypothetical protein BRC65_08175 [Halobacteriales archaeon QH_2_65_14]
MTSSSSFVSLRLFLSRWFLAVALVALGLALVGGYVAYDAHVDGAETVVEQRTAGTWTVDSTFDHAATVERDVAVFSAGERLENRNLYFTTVSPRLNGTYTLGHDNTDGEPATASIELSVVIRAVEEIEETEVVHWQTRESLETRDVEIEDGSEASTTVSVNLSTILDRIESIQRDLGAEPGETEVLLVAETTVETVLADETFSNSRTERIEIEPGEAVYRVDTAVEGQRSDEVTERVTRTVEPSVLALYGGPLFALVGLLGVVGLPLARLLGWLSASDGERARHEFETARDDFDQWISRARIPDAGGRTVVPADTLADLVDIAIDSDRRVLEDGDRYAVLVDDVVYTYTAPSPATGDTEPLGEGDGTAAHAAGGSGVATARDGTDGTPTARDTTGTTQDATGTAQGNTGTAQDADANPSDDGTGPESFDP